MSFQRSSTYVFYFIHFFFFFSFFTYMNMYNCEIIINCHLYLNKNKFVFRRFYVRALVFLDLWFIHFIKISFFFLLFRIFRALIFHIIDKNNTLFVYYTFTSKIYKRFSCRHWKSMRIKDRDHKITISYVNKTKFQTKKGKKKILIKSI